MLKSPARNATATPSPVKTSGVALTSVRPIADGEPIAPEIRAA
jgi:hypothetical protein